MALVAARAVSAQALGAPAQVRKAVHALGPIRTVWLFWALTGLYGFAALHRVFPYQHAFESNGDVTSYFQWSLALWHGAVPYVSFFMPYPPGLLPIIALPPASLAVYQAEFFIAALAVDALVTRALLRSGRVAGAAFWVAAAPLLGPIFWSRLDIFVAGMLVAGVLAFERGRYTSASVWLAWAGLVKLWPLLLLVVLLPLVPRERRRSFVLPTLSLCAAAVVPFLAAGGAHDLWLVLRVQSGRGVELESLFALPLYVLRAAGGAAPVVLGASYQFIGSADWTVAAVSTVLLAAAVGYCLFRGLLRPPKGWTATHWLLLVVSLVLLTDRVLSPQYLVWGAAAVALFVARVPGRRLLPVSAALLLVATQLQFPFGFPQLVLVTPIALPLSAAHAVALLLFGAVAIRAVHAKAAEPAGASPSLLEGERLQLPGEPAEPLALAD